MRFVHRSLLAAALILTAAPARSATLVLDAMTDALAPSPCLPVTQQAVVFLGHYCDAVACPPGTVIVPEDGTLDCSTSEQSGLVGVFGGNRVVSIRPGGAPEETTTARIDPAAGALRLVTRVPEGVGVGLTYDGGSSRWNRDLSATTELRSSIAGDVSPDAPILVGAWLVDRRDEGQFVAEATAVLTSAGPVSLPISTFFSGDPEFDLHSVDEIQFFVLDCTDAPCPPVAPGHDVTIGPITLETDLAVPALPSSWGALKTRYR